MNIDPIVQGEDRAARHIDDIGDRAKDPKPVLNRVADLLQRRQAANFASHGASLGGWPPLAASTVAKKRSAGQSIEPLVATGALERSLQAGRGKGKVRRVTKTRVTIGSRIFYGRFAQAGTSRGEPKRPIVGITNVEAKLATKLIDRYIRTGRW